LLFFVYGDIILNVPGKESIVDEIKCRCNIVDVIGQVVSLKKAGSNYKGLCPFHNEKTPSFVVSDAKQIFSCFGCNAAGDVFEFVQRHYSLDFPATVEKLATEYGIDTKGAQYKSSNKDELYEINREAARFFYKSFLTPGNPATAYMQGRGIDPETTKRFGIGYADGEWDSLLRHFKALGTDVKLLVSLGLVTESKGKHYDKFRDRVMFPIINTSGKVIGFGGRALAGAEPKYLNSAESSVFLKKNNLFGLNLTKQDISKENRGILVEGYMDVISLYQHGVRNVLASLGTALTENQAKLLKRYTLNVVLAYDADEAGQAAALRGAEILYNEGLKAKVLQIPSGKDPDDYVREHKKSGFLELADAALPYAEYKLEAIKKKYDIADTDGKLDFIKEAVVFLRTLRPTAAETYIKMIAKDINISENAITLEYNGNTIERIEKTNVSKSAKNEDNTGKLPDVLEKNLIRFCILSKDYFEKIQSFEHAFTSRYGYEIFKSLEAYYLQGDGSDVKNVMDSLDENGVKIIEDILETVFFAGKEEQIFADCIRKIESSGLIKREKEIVQKLSMADEAENAEQIDILTRELIEVQREIQRKKS